MRGNSENMPGLSAQLEVEVKLVYAKMHMTRSGLEIRGNLGLTVTTLDDTTMANLLRCTGVSMRLKHHLNYNKAEGTAVTHILSSDFRLNPPLVT